MYTRTVPVLDRFLGGLSGVLTKAEDNAAQAKIDPQALAQNAAAYAVFAYLAASAEGGFGRAPKPAAAAP